MQYEQELDIYGDATILKRFQTNETSISVIQGNISAIISESELIELTNSQATMYSKLASAILDIDSLTVNFSDLTTKYDTVTNQYSQLSSQMSTFEVSLDGLSADITSVERDLSNNYSTTSEMNTAINAKAGEITAEVSALENNLQNNYSTTTSMNATIDVKLNQLSLSVSNSIAAESDRIDKLETWRSEASLKITDSAIVSTVIESGTYTDSVNSMIEQKADSIRLRADRISWDSTYSSMTASGTLTCQNANIEGTIHSNNGNHDIYMRNARLEFEIGVEDVGNIGTNELASDSTKRGLALELNHNSQFLSMAALDSYSASSFAMKWYYMNNAITIHDVYYAANTLNSGCSIYLHHHRLYPGNGTDYQIFSYTNGICLRSSEYIFLEIGTGDGLTPTLRLSDKSIYVTNSSILEIGTNSGITAYNNTKLNFYADLDMHWFSVLNNSDERLKKNIASPNVNPMEILSKLELFQYDWRENDIHEDMGLIAQQVLDVLPSAVKLKENGIYGLKYMAFIPYIIGAIQYLYKMISPMTINEIDDSGYVPSYYTPTEIEEAMEREQPMIPDDEKGEPAETKVVSYKKAIFD